MHVCIFDTFPEKLPHFSWCFHFNAPDGTREESVVDKSWFVVAHTCCVLRIEYRAFDQTLKSKMVFTAEYSVFQFVSIGYETEMWFEKSEYSVYLVQLNYHH